MADSQAKPSFAETIAPTAGLKGKDFDSTEASPEGTPSIRSEELVVGGYGSDHHHVFAKPEVAEYWRGVYEAAQYEGRHRFDPDVTWSAEEEKKLLRKVSCNAQNHKYVMTSTLQDRLEDHDLVLADVSRPGSQSTEHQPCHLRRHAQRVGYEHERLQHWADHISPLFLVRRTTIWLDLQKGWS